LSLYPKAQRGNSLGFLFAAPNGKDTASLARRQCLHNGIAGLRVRLLSSVAFAGDKLAAMKSVHLVIPDLFLPKDIAAEVCADLRLPALEKHLCELFGIPCQADAPVAPISAAFDGLAAGCWLHVVPVHLRLQRSDAAGQDIG
jgi:hypothetical protein